MEAQQSWRPVQTRFFATLAALRRACGHGGLRAGKHKTPDRQRVWRNRSLDPRGRC